MLFLIPVKTSEHIACKTISAMIWSTLGVLAGLIAAFVLLLLLWVLVGIAALLFGAIVPRAGKLLLPYLAWLTFAAYLNLGVWLLNR